VHELVIIETGHINARFKHVVVICVVLCIVCICVVLCIVCVQMCTVLLSPCVNPTAVDKYISYHTIHSINICNLPCTIT